MPGVETRTRQTPDGYEVTGTLDLQTLKQLGLIHTFSSGAYLRAGFFRAEFSSSEKSTETNTENDAKNKVLEKWISWKATGTPEADFHVPSALGLVRLEQD